MSINWIKQKVGFTGRITNPFDKKKSSLQPRIVIAKAYTLIAGFYCASSAILFYYVVENIFLAIIHLLALFSIVTNYLILIQTKKFNRAGNIILTTGTLVVLSLFATGGWAHTGYLWPFAYLPFAFFLPDKNTSMKWVAALFSGCLIVVVLHFIGVITIPYSLVALVNYFAALLIFTICMFLFQKATIKREEFLTYTETFLEAAPDAVIIIDREGRIVKWNPKSEILFGWTAGEVLGKPLTETIIPHRYREAHEKGLKHFLGTGEGPVLGTTIEIQALNKNNVEFDVALSISPTIVQDKLLFIGFVRDITERKISEEKLLKLSQELEQKVLERTEKINISEKKYRYLFKNNPLPMWVIDLNTFKFLDVNEMAILQYGYSREEFLSMTTLDIRPDEDKELFKQPDHLFEMSKTNYSKGIWNHRKKDGTIIQAETIGHKIIFEGVTARLILSNDITEKKKAEEKLDKSEKLFRAMIEKDADLKTLSTRDGKVFYASPSITTILGYENQEFITMPAFELIHPDDVPDFIEGVTDIVQIPGKSFYRQQRLKHKNGTWLWCEGTTTNMLHEPAVAALVSNFRDITERKKFEEAQALFALIVSSSDDAILSKTLDGIITSWNHGAEKIFGYSSNEIIGTHISILIPPHLQNEETEIMEKIRRGEGIYHYETERIKKDGEVFYVSLSISPIKDSHGNIIGASKILRDISEKRRLEEEQQAAHERLVFHIENTPLAFIEWDEQGLAKSWSKRAEEIFGWSEREFIEGQETAFSQVYHEDLPLVHKKFEQLICGKLERNKVQNRNITKDGRVIWCEWFNSVLRDGKVKTIMSLVQNITEQKQLERQKDDFLSIASHELKTPVTTIKAYGQISESMLEKKGDVETLGMIKKMGTQVNKLTTLIEDLLDVTKVQKGKLKYTEAFFDFNELVKDVIDDMQKTSSTHEITNKPGKNTNVFGDKDKVGQVLNNLISNAIKYSPKAGSIVVSTELQKDGIQLCVKDFGIGISAKDHQNVFEQFYRVNGDHQTTFPGMGIGLYICSEILRRQGGKIWVESNIGKGSIFYVWLPFDHRNETVQFAGA